jgi:hypothetical protein
LTTCGDGIKAGQEQCDNFHQTGCTNCYVDIGYVCIGDFGTTSSCATVCGDNIKAGS